MRFFSRREPAAATPASEALDSLEFIDEPAFRELAKAFHDYIITIKSTSRRHLGRSEVVNNEIYRDKLRATVRNSEALFRDWKFPAVGGSGPCIDTDYFIALDNNQALLARILDRAADPRHVEQRRQRELAHRGLHSKKIFVGHGHDHKTLAGVCAFLRTLELTPVVLHNEPNLGRTVIEKFEQNADVGFAVVVLTPDDMGADRSAAEGGRLNPRARQNVILELGYFIARLGRDRVCALRLGEVEMPSDIFGVVFTTIDPAGAWRIEVAKELKAVGYEFDFNKVLSTPTNRD